MRRTTLVAGLLAAGLLASGPSTAKADFGIGFSSGLPFFGGPLYDYSDNRYRSGPRRDAGKKYSCKQARRLVRRNGYRKIRAFDCRGRVYGFYARSGGEIYKIRVNVRSGRIISARRS